MKLRFTLIRAAFSLHPHRVLRVLVDPEETRRIVDEEFAKNYDRVIASIAKRYQPWSELIEETIHDL